MIIDLTPTEQIGLVSRDSLRQEWHANNLVNRVTDELAKFLFRDLTPANEEFYDPDIIC